MDLWPREEGMKHGVRYNRNVFGGAEGEGHTKVRGGMRLWFVGSVDNLLSGNVKEMDHTQDSKDKSTHSDESVSNKSATQKDDAKSTGSQPNYGKTITHACRKFSDRTSLQGVTLVGRTSCWYRKFFWITVFLGALGGCIFQVVSLTRKYMKYETQLTVQLGFGPQPFPSVTLCNLNIIRKSQLNQTTQELKSFLKMADSGDSGGNYTPVYNDLEFDGPKPTSEIFNPRSHFDIMQQDYIYLASKMERSKRLNAGHQIKNMLMNCSYDGRDCSHQNFSHVFTRENGNCFTFNNQGNNPLGLRAQRWGERWGLILMLNLEKFEYLDIRAMERGFMVRIHPFGTMPTMGDRSFAVSAGFVNRASMRSEMIIRKGLPYSKCGDTNNFHDELKFQYTREACFHTCTDRLVAEHCSCFRVDYIENYPETDLNKLRPCSEENDSNQNRVADTACIGWALNETCSTMCDCQPPCMETNYFVTHSTSRWPNEKMWDELVTRTCDVGDEMQCELLNSTKPQERLAVLRENYVVLQVFFSNLNTKNLTEVPLYEATQFVSDLGGTLGLYVGASFLTLVELVDLLRELLTILVNGAWSRRGAAQKPA